LATPRPCWSGVADGQHLLFVYVDRLGGPCYQDGYDESPSGGVPVTSETGDVVPAGSFSLTYTYTPAAESTDTICAYLSTASSDPPDASGVGALDVQPPTGSITINTNPTPIQTRPTTFNVSGTIQIPRETTGTANAWTIATH
jgi:hypothetical protein